MASAKQDFEKFLAWLHQPENEAPADVRRLANLVLTHFAELSQTFRQHNRRSVHLVRLARIYLDHMPDTPPGTQDVAANGVWPWRRLRHLTLGPFRGFRRPEPFDLQQRVVLFYGPNGSGKTSLCEALEYALLGSVEEAGIRRIDARTYLSNTHEGRFDAPVVLATDHTGRETRVAADPEAYQFCFIEKNRIDAFSRIAARPPAQRTELIAALFGMDSFNEFVNNFNESIDQQLVLSAQKQLELTNRRSVLSADQAAIDDEANGLLNLDNEEAELALRYSEGMTFAGLKTLIGSDEAPGRLQELQQIVNAIPPEVIGLTRQVLLDTFGTAYRRFESLTAINAKLQARSNQVSFKDLYTAVLELQAAEGDHCPACDTPLAGQIHVAVNPYEKATVGLAQLKELTELQEEREAVQAELAMASRELRGHLASLTSFVVAQGEQETPLGRYLVGLAAEPTGNWWAEVYPPDGAEETAPTATAATLNQILATADRVAAQDADSLHARGERERNIAERDRLNDFRISLQAQDLRRQGMVDSVAAAKGRIEAFDRDNERFITEVAQEARDIARDAPIKAAYDRFLATLRSYRNQLPGTLLAGLNDTAMNLYNEFNKSDLDCDKLADLQLPETGEQKIEISFQGDPQVRLDALRVLSEGHIRCLGLAILLAKSRSIQSPLIVFDDVINAIDHDHRRGIRETIFESDHFADSQLLVTCHSDEFIKDIENQFHSPRRNECRVYLIRNHDGDYQPRVAREVPSRSYVERARASSNLLRHRDALASSRQALEMLSQKTWRWLMSNDMGTLKLLVDGPKAPINLYNLCDALRQKLTDATAFAHPNKVPLIAAYERVLGIPATNLVWVCLNKGTHEEADRDDFDAALVEDVVQTIEALDRLDLRCRRRRETGGVPMR